MLPSDVGKEVGVPSDVGKSVGNGVGEDPLLEPLPDFVMSLLILAERRELPFSNW